MRSCSLTFFSCTRLVDRTPPTLLLPRVGISVEVS